MILRRTCERALVGALVVLGSAAPAWAQPADDPAAAEALFDTARGLVNQGDWEGGCPKFDASFKLHASASTAINLARCHAHFGRVASAWTTYGRALALIGETPGVTRQQALQDVATRERAEIAPRLPKLRIVVGKPPPGLTVTRDGAVVALAALGDSLPADPGPHEIVASAPGYRTEKTTVTAREREEVTAELALTVQVAPPPVDAPPGPPAPPTPPPARGVSPWAWGWGTAGVGLALTGVSLGFLAMDLDATKTLRRSCYSDAQGTGCRPGYDPASDNARKNVGFGVFVGAGVAGLAALATGTYGIVTGARARREARTSRAPAVIAPWLAPGGGGLGAVGAF